MISSDSYCPFKFYFFFLLLVSSGLFSRRSRKKLIIKKMCTKVKNGRGQLYRIIMDFFSGAGPAGWRTAQESVYVVNATERTSPTTERRSNMNPSRLWSIKTLDNAVEEEGKHTHNARGGKTMERRRVTGPLSSDLPQKKKNQKSNWKKSKSLYTHSGEGRAGSV